MNVKVRGGGCGAPPTSGGLRAAVVVVVLRLRSSSDEDAVSTLSSRLRSTSGALCRSCWFLRMASTSLLLLMGRLVRCALRERVSAAEGPGPPTRTGARPRGGDGGGVCSSSPSL